jgi:hypothetical protein
LMNTREEQHLGINNALSFSYGVVIFLAAAVGSFITDWRLRGLAADDSYIHLRIARNLVETGHAFFNASDKVMVTSSPLWTIVLAVSQQFFHHLPPALPLEALAMGLAALCAFLLAHRCTPASGLTGAERLIYLIAAPVATFAILLQSSVEQMETPLAVALVLAAALLFSKQNRWWFCLLVLAGWTRYEYLACAVCVLPLALYFKRMSRSAALLGLATLVIGALCVLQQYGTVVPNTVHAKAVGYVLSYSYVAQSLGFGWRAIGLVRFLLLLAVLVILIAQRFRDYRQFIPNALMLGGAGLLALYFVKKAYVFLWYLPLAEVPLVLGLLLGVAFAGKRLFRWVALAAVLVLLPGKSLCYESLAVISNRPLRDRSDLINLRVQEYLAVGRAVRSACPTGRLMTSEIGGLGEGFRGTILDGFGLASPEAMKFHPMRVPEDRSGGYIGAIPIGFVNEARPDVIVSYPTFAESIIKKIDPSVFTEYSYNALPASLSKVTGVWPTGSPLLVWVAKAGGCSATAVDTQIRTSLAAN